MLKRSLNRGVFFIIVFVFCILGNNHTNDLHLIVPTWHETVSSEGKKSCFLKPHKNVIFPEFHKLLWFPYNSQRIPSNWELARVRFSLFVPFCLSSCFVWAVRALFVCTSIWFMNKERIANKHQWFSCWHIHIHRHSRLTKWWHAYTFYNTLLMCVDIKMGG